MLEQRLVPGVPRRVPVALRRGTTDRRQAGEGRGLGLHAAPAGAQSPRRPRPVKKLSVTLVRRRQAVDRHDADAGEGVKARRRSRAKAPTKVAEGPAQGEEGRSRSNDVAEEDRQGARRRPTCKVAKAPPKAKKAAKSSVAPVTPPPAVALRRGRHPVNPEVGLRALSQRASHRFARRR